jgi:(p)ppGpp synthase/HD superfamily hydrolase
MQAADQVGAPTIASTDEFAAKAHASQLYGGEPYVEHVRRVAKRLQARGEWAVMAGLLHSVVEDCGVDLAALYDMGYPDVVVEAVDAVTRRDGEEYDELIARAAAHPLGCLVKLADNLDNTAHLPEIALADPERADRLRVKYSGARMTLVVAVTHHERRGGGTFGPLAARVPW